MTLDTIINAVKIIDEEVCRGYTRVSQYWTKRGGDVDQLAAYIGIPGYILSTVTAIMQNNICVSLAFPIGTHMHDYISNCAALYKRENYSQKASVLDIVDNDDRPEFFKEIDSMTRLPTFVAGALLTAEKMYESVSCFVSGNSSDDMAGYSIALGVGLGVGLLAVASSQYLKARDPTLLDREPFWKMVYNKLTTPEASVLCPVPIKK